MNLFKKCFPTCAMLLIAAASVAASTDKDFSQSARDTIHKNRSWASIKDPGYQRDSKNEIFKLSGFIKEAIAEKE